MERKTAVREQVLKYTEGKFYGMKAKGPNFTEKQMTVGDLIRELQAFPERALALISVDEEGNDFKHLCNLSGCTHEEEEADELRFTRHDLKVGDPYIIIWPHG